MKRNAMNSKIIDLSDPLGTELRLPRPIVFTNGVFDLLHAGHVTYLAQARALGNSLFVAINSDASVRGLNKAPNRPINAAADRATVIAALESVSAVGLFEESKPLEVLMRVRPDIYVKGGDYDIETLEETALIRSWNGSAVSIPFIPGYSTTLMIDRACIDGHRSNI